MRRLQMQNMWTCCWTRRDTPDTRVLLPGESGTASMRKTASSEAKGHVLTAQHPRFLIFFLLRSKLFYCCLLFFFKIENRNKNGHTAFYYLQTNHRTQIVRFLKISRRMVFFWGEGHLKWFHFSLFFHPQTQISVPTSEPSGPQPRWVWSVGLCRPCSHVPL